MAMHPRDLATLLDLYEEDVYQAGEPARAAERRRMHGLD
jgi:hypothetical protein